MLSASEMLLLGGISTAVLFTLGREVYNFYRFRDAVGMLDRSEWSRVMRMLRD